MGAFDAYMNQIQGETRQINAQTTAATDVFVSGATNMIKDRWWKKEFEEFQESAGADFQNMMSQVGEMTADETFEDIPGLWNLYTSGVMKYMDKVAEYPTNPYISAAGQKMFGFMQKQFGELTGSVTAQAELAGTQREAEMREELFPLKKRELEAGIAAQEALASQREAKAGAAGLGVEGSVTYGKRKDFVLAPIDAHLGMIQRTSTYRKRKSDLGKQQAASDWQALSMEEKVTGYGGDFNTFRATHPGLTTAEQEEFDKQEFTQHLVELGKYEPSVIRSIVNDRFGVKKPAMADAVEAAKVQKVPVKYPDNTFVQSGAPTSQALAFQTDEDLSGKNLFEDPPDFPELQEKYAGSPAHILVSEYKRRRDEGLTHDKAVEDLFLNREAGGSGLASVIADDIFESVDTPVGRKSMENWRLDLIKMLQTYRDYYEGNIMENEIRALEQQVSMEGGIVSGAGAVYLTRQTQRAMGGLIKAAGKPIGGLMEAVGEMTPFIETEAEQLAAGKKPARELPTGPRF